MLNREQHVFLASLQNNYRIQPNTNQNNTCNNFEVTGGLAECVALWTDHRGLPVRSLKSGRRSRRSFENPVGNPQITVRRIFSKQVLK